MERLIECEITRKNLTLLMNGAREAVTKVTEFNMGLFRFNDDDSYQTMESLLVPPCGTSACYLGLAPLIDGLEPESYRDFELCQSESGYPLEIMWNLYSDRLFPFLTDRGDLWSYLFGPGNVNNLDNAIDRTKRLLEA